MRTILLILLLFTAVTATTSGIFLVNDPTGSILNMHVSFLSATPFKSYFIPGLILVTAIGLISFVSFYCVSEKTMHQYRWATMSGVLLILWITIQILLLQTLHWLQLLFLAIGVLIALISYQLKGRWAV